MIIESSQLQLSAQSVAQREQVRLSRQVATPAPVTVAATDSVPADNSSDDVADPRLLLLQRVAEMMLGRKFKVYGGGHGAAVHSRGSSAPAVHHPRQQTTTQTVNLSVESQKLSVGARGSVQTADGRQIDFQAALQLSSQYASITSTSSTETPATKDPLVLNFDGRGVRLSGEKINFDLNADGTQESMPTVASGSGILFADRNQDGVANDGTELFGAQSGNGFADLAKQDSDGNGWIDQADPIYGQLRIWFQDANGGHTYSLADLGVGALSTANVATPFNLRDTASLLGQIRSSGVYLMEDGRAGFVSHVDLAA